MRQTPLHDEHEPLGGKMVEFGGWRMPVQYGPILEEVRCVRERVGLFDLSHMGRFNITGPDAVAFVDRVATCYCARIPIGAIRYGLLCRPTGNPIDDILVYRSEDEVFMVVNAGNADADREWLLAHADGFEVALEDQTDDLAMIALQGPLSEESLARVTEDLDLSELGYYKFARGTVCGCPNVRVSRTGYTGEDGFEIYLPTQQAIGAWRSLLEAGQTSGMAPIGLGARDTLRLEAGMPLYGHEIDAEHNPIEAGLKFGVSFLEEKGDWIGRAPLEALHAAPTRALVGLVTEGKRVPRQGYTLFDGEQSVGTICSGAVSPTVGKNIATAYLPLHLAQTGQVVDMDLRGKRQACTVVDLPFYSRKRS